MLASPRMSRVMLKADALSVLMTLSFSQSFRPFSALPRKRFAAAMLRIGER